MVGKKPSPSITRSQQERQLAAGCSRSVAWASPASACDSATSWQCRRIRHWQNQNPPRKRPRIHPLCLTYRLPESRLHICRSPSAWDRYRRHDGELPMQVFVGRPLNVHQLQDLGYDMHRCGSCTHYYDLPVFQVVVGSPTYRAHGLAIKDNETRYVEDLGYLVGQRRTLDNQ